MRRSLLFLFLLLLPLATAKTGHMTLLTVVQQPGQTSTGGTADLYLEIRPGSGRIFIDSFPLTKLDTQISTRFANQVACSYLETDCSPYDFFYKIEASSPIVGGPSAGAPIAVLTIAVLKDLPLANDTVMTGTIDAGGLIGPVSGIYEKALAAEKAGYKKVLLPKWSPSVLVLPSINLTNRSLNLTNITLSFNSSEALTNLTVHVVRVGTVDEALYQFTGQYLNNRTTHFAVTPEYTRIMQNISMDLCNRSQALQRLVDHKKLNYTDENNFSRRARTSYESGKYYATASYCFSQNIRLLNKLLENKTPLNLHKSYTELILAVTQLANRIDNQTLETLSDLETHMIVKERLLETLDTLQELNTSNLSSTALAYALERYYSAKVWSQFFGLPGKKLLLDKDHLKESCQKKISEAEERLSYVDLYAPGYLGGSREQLNQAYTELGNEAYAMCLFTASRIKAEADVFITASGVDSSQLSNLTQEQLRNVRRVIAKEQSQGLFPILGYSYLEYAESLVDDNPVSAVTFAQYALELSNLDMYFPKTKALTLPNEYAYFAFGLIIGILSTLSYWHYKRRD